MKNIKLSEVFAFSRSGLIISMIELGTMVGIGGYLFSLILFPLMTLADTDNVHRLPVFDVAFWVAIISAVSGALFTLAIKRSVFLWKIFKPNSSQIAAWKRDKVEKLKIRKTENINQINNLQRENLEIEEEIGVLTFR